jgi:simple sugar transport system permease protein
MRDVSLFRIPYLSHLPIVGRGLFSQSPVLYGAVIIGIAIWAVLKFTRAGLLLRAAGEGAAAADAAGISVTIVRFCAILFTGLMAGLGGAYLAIVASGGVFVDNMTDGRGYLAIAIAIFGRWQPFWVMLAAVMFGFAEALQYQGQSLGLNIPPALLLMFPFVIALLAWVGLGRSKTSPANLGQPFLRGNR